MKNNKNNDKHRLESQSYINTILLKFEKDIMKHVDKTIDKKSKFLQQQLKNTFLNLSQKSHKNTMNNFFNPNKGSFGSSGDTGFNLSSNQLLTSFASELKKKIFNNF